MMTKRKFGALYLLILWALISALCWPAFVAAASALSWLTGEGWQLDAWSEIPKQHMLEHFLTGYQRSCIVAIPIGFIAVVDYLLLSRYRITWWIAGILLPIAGAVIALSFFATPMVALPTLVASGLLLAVFYRMLDLLAGSNTRGRLR